MVISKTEFVKEIASKAGVTQKVAGSALKAVTDLIIKSVSENNSVFLSGFGTFKNSQRASRAGRNPKTGEVIQIAARKAISFKPHKAFKTSVNK